MASRLTNKASPGALAPGVAGLDSRRGTPGTDAPGLAPAVPGLGGLAVSIITPSFNQGRFLRRTIDSVLAQDYRNLEYLVIDGGSTDESLAILRSYGDCFSWCSQADRGQAHAINQGIGLARGDIVAYLNSDDVLAPGAVARVVRAFTQYPAAQVVYGDAYVIDEQDRVTGRYPTADFDHDLLGQTCFLCQPATFWRRDVTSLCGAFDETLHYALDYEYWLRLAAQGVRFQRLATPLACTRSHGETKTLAHRLEVFREILAVSRRYRPQAALGQYEAYWHYRCHESPTGWPRWLRWLPAIHRWLARAHRRWDGIASRRAGPGGVTPPCVVHGGDEPRRSPNLARFEFPQAAGRVFESRG